MREWHDKQKKPNTKLRDLLKSNKAKTCKLSELSKTEQNRLYSVQPKIVWTIEKQQKRRGKKSVQYEGGLHISYTRTMRLN